jgi:hypothetical protein
MAAIDMPSNGASVPHLVQRRGNVAWSRRLAASRIVHAHSEDRLLTWSYTAGLLGAYGHSEFLLTGLDPFLAESVLSQLAERVSLGRMYSEADLERDLLHRFTCAFREVPPSMAEVLMRAAYEKANGRAVRVLQCIYPDNHNRLPWHFGYNTSWHDVQPLFTSELPITKVERNLLRAAAGANRLPAHTF